MWRSRRGVRQERNGRRFSFDMSVVWFFNQYDQTHGAPRLTAVLARNGIPFVGKKTVAASLRRQGLRAVSSRMFRHPRSKDVKECVYEDSCNRQWDKGSLDKVWITDFTYLRSGQGWVYLVAVRDAHTKRVIGYAMGVSQVTGLVRQALNMAYACRERKPAGLVLHADRGCQFTSRELGEYAKKAGLTLSMGRTGVCWDNAMAESFWSTLKIEYYYRHAFRTREEVYEGCLLYTSPSPRDRQKSRMPSSA